MIREFLLAHPGRAFLRELMVKSSQEPILDGENALTPGQYGKVQIDETEGAYCSFEQELSALCTGK